MIEHSFAVPVQMIFRLQGFLLVESSYPLSCFMCLCHNVQLSRSLNFKSSSPPTVRATSIKTEKTEKPDKPAKSAEPAEPAQLAGWKDLNGMEKLGVVEVDPMLAPHQNHLRYRYREFLKRKMEIEKVEGSLENFAKGEYSSSLQSHQVLVIVMT